MKRYLFGKFVESTTLQKSDVVNICMEARIHSSALQSYPFAKVLEFFGRLQKKWADPNYIYRVQALEVLPGLTGFSKPMIELGLAELHQIFDPEQLSRKMKSELGSIPRSNVRFSKSLIGIEKKMRATIDRFRPGPPKVNNAFLRRNHFSLLGRAMT